MSDKCGNGFLTLYQGLLIVVVSGVVVFLALVAIIIVAMQYNKIAKILRKAEKHKPIQPPMSYTNSPEAITSSMMFNQYQPRQEPNRRSSMIPRPQIETPGQEYSMGNYSSQYQYLPGYYDAQRGQMSQNRSQPALPERKSIPKVKSSEMLSYQNNLSQDMDSRSSAQGTRIPLQPKGEQKRIKMENPSNSNFVLKAP